MSMKDLHYVTALNATGHLGGFATSIAAGIDRARLREILSGNAVPTDAEDGRLEKLEDEYRRATAIVNALALRERLLVRK